MSMTFKRTLVTLGLSALLPAALGACSTVTAPDTASVEDCYVAPEDIPTNRRHFTSTMPVETLLETSKLESCAASGSLAGQTVLAVRLLTGTDIEEDKARGERLLREAAEVHRHPDAMYNLGAAYAAGVFGEKDDATALAWFEQAAEAGDPNGLHWVGFFHWAGRVVELDKTKALDWFEQAASRKHAEAAFMLGQAYHTGDTYPEDWDKAMEWYKKADTWDFHQRAQWNMARIRQERQKELSQ